MKFSSSTVAVSSLLLASATASLAAPAPSSQKRSSDSSSSVHVPIRKRELQQRSGSDLLDWANAQKAHLQNKYHLNDESSNVQKRQTAGGTYDSLTNIQYDSLWVAEVTGGTPSRSYEVVLDTGSSDFWLTSTSYNPSSSSSFRNDSETFSITYGSGQVAGYSAQDDFTLAGTTVNNLRFAVATSVSSDLVSAGMDGIMGMGFPALANSGDSPFWSAANVNTFAFYLNRASQTTANTEQPGGIFTFGGYNSSLYQGDISYNSVIEQLYWMIRLGGASASGSSVNLNGLTRAAIDTGTTLIGGPDSVVQSLYAEIPGSQSQGNGYYSYPCSSTINATLTFGNQQYTIADSDFSAGTLDRAGTTCLGAFFGLGTSSQTSLQWIVGDAFLKNVYTIFTTSGSARVGFAPLASGLNSGTTARTVSSTVAGNSSPAGKTHLLDTSMLSLAAAALSATVLAALL